MGDRLRSSVGTRLGRHVSAILLAGACLGLCLALPASASALMSTGNGGWLWLDAQPQGNNLEAVSALDAQHAVAAGDNGTMLTTSDGGATWSAHVPGVAGAHVADLSFVNGDDGWAVLYLQNQNKNLLAHTSDGGSTWTAERFAWNPGSVDFVDASHGWATGDDPPLRKDGVWSTANGGRTWKFHPVPLAWGFSSIDFIDATHGWAVGGYSIVNDPMAGSVAAIFATSDGGTSWHRQSLATDGQWLHTVSFVNADDGWAVGTGSDMGGAGIVFATTDGGATWSPQSAGTDWDLSGVTFVDATHGWLPEGSSIYATTDGGATWTAHDAGISTTAVSFADDLHGYAVGPGGAMATTTDGGLTWQARSTTTPGGGVPLLSALAFPDATNGWAVGDHVILATADGGATWTSQTVGADLTGVSFPDTTHGWAVGGSGPADSPAVLNTTDGGLSWQTQFTSTSRSGPYRGVDFLDAAHGWVTGSGGGHPLVGITVDGGANWKFVELRDTHTLAKAVSFVDATHGWVVCAPINSSRYPSIILRTTNGGLTWKLQDITKRKIALRDITFTDRWHGWAVGQNGGSKGACIVLTTRDGGRTWSRQNLSAAWRDAGLQVRFVDRPHGWIACGQVIYATVDGGRHWRAQRPGSEVDALAFTDRVHGWAAAESADWTSGGGGILATTTGGFRPGQ